MAQAYGARLRVTSPPGHGFASGAIARIWLDDVEISANVGNVQISIPADGPMSATITFYLSELNADVPVEVAVPA